MKKLMPDQRGLIPLLIMLFAIVITLIVLAYMRVSSAN